MYVFLRPGQRLREWKRGAYSRGWEHRRFDCTSGPSAQTVVLVGGEGEGYSGATSPRADLQLVANRKQVEIGRRMST